MGVQVVILASAEADLQDIKSYLIQQFDRQTWQACYHRLKESISLISRYPEVGGVPDELSSLNMTQFHQVISGMNRIIYEVHGDIAYIHIVCDIRQDLKSLLTRRIVRPV